MLNDSLNISNDDIEMLTIVINRKYQKRLCISIIYLPPKSNDREAIHYITRTAEIIEEKNYEWIIGGDLNINLNSENCILNKKLIQNFAGKFSLTQLITQPTRVTKTSATLIDHIYHNDTYQVQKSGKITYALSDHDLTYIVLKRNLPKKERIEFCCRKLIDYKKSDLRDILWLLDWIRSIVKTIQIRAGIFYITFIWLAWTY